MGAAGSGHADGRRGDPEAAPLLGGGKDVGSGALDEDNERFYLGHDRSLLFDTPPEGLSEDEAARRLGIFGPNKLAEKDDDKFIKLLLEFVQPMALIVWFAIIIEIIEAILDSVVFGEGAKGQVVDVCVLFVLQMLNVFVGWIEELKASDAIASLREALKPEATVIREGVTRQVNATTVVPGDRVLLGSGCAIPADCTVCAGKPIQVDQAALTGESMPVTMAEGSVAKMGSTITRGEVEAIVTATGGETFFGKTAALISGVDDMDNLEKTSREVTIVLVVAGVIVCVVVFIYLMAIGESFLDTLSFCVVLLVASVPIAMRVVFMTTLALGCSILADEKAIVARLAAVEELAGMKILCSDKTGTLTLNKMVLQDELPFFTQGISRYDVLVAAALGAKWREPPKDALDTLVLGALDTSALDEAYELIDHVPFDPTVKRTESTIRRKADDSTFKVTKGAPHILLEMVHNKDEIAEEFDAKVIEFASRGIRSLAVAATFDDGDGEEKWRMLGIMTFLDPPRPDTKHTIERARELGVDIKMITGDHSVIAVETSKQLGLGPNVLPASKLPTLSIQELESSETLGRDWGELCENADGFAQVFPEHKYLIVEALRQRGASRGHRIGMTGDGVNDAPALKKADVGIAVQGATDAAQAAADIVLTEPGLSVIVLAIVTSRKVFQRMKNFVIYRVACTWQILVFFFISCIFVNPSKFDDDWPKYFDLPVIAMVTLTILNDGTLISIAYDNVNASRVPERWEMPVLYVVSSVIGVVTLISSVWLLMMGLTSCTEGSIFDNLGLECLEFEQVRTLMYLKISLTNYFAVFNSRSKSWAWDPLPSWQLFLAFWVATICATILSKWWFLGPAMQGINFTLILLVWAYCFLWALIQEVVKVLLYMGLRYFGFVDDISFVDESKLVMTPEDTTADDDELDPQDEHVSVDVDNEDDR